MVDLGKTEAQLLFVIVKKKQNIRAAFIVEVGKDQLYTVFQVDAEFFFNSNHMKIQVYKIGIQLN